MEGGEHDDAAVWGPDQRRLTVGLILTVSMTAFEALAVATSLPATLRDLGGLTYYGWAFSAFMLANLVSICVAGRAADQHGVARPFLVGSILFVAGLVGAGLAPSMPVVVGSRAVQGCGAGAISSAAYVAVARAYAARARPHMLAMLSTAWVLPGLIGPTLAGTVTDHLGWRWVFLGLAPCVVVASGLVMPALRRLSPGSASGAAEDQTVAAFRLAAGTGVLLYAMGSGSVLVAAPLMIAGLLAGFPAFQQLMPAGTLRAQPGLPAAIAALGLVSFAFFGTEAFLPLMLTTVRGQSNTMAGIVLTAATISWTAGAWIQARLAAHRSHRGLATVGLLLTVGGIAGTTSVLSRAVPVWMATIMWGITGLGMGLAYSTTTLVVLNSAPRGREGVASSAMQLANVLGVALGTGLAGDVLALAMTAGRSEATGVGLVNLMTVIIGGLGVMAARGLPGRPSHGA